MTVNTKIVDCTVRVASVSRFIDLVTHAQDGTIGVPEDAPTHVSLVFNSSVKPMVGSFKIAFFGHTSVPIFQPTSSSTRVCIKQCYYHGDDGAPGRPPSRHLYDSCTQAKKLALEMYCATWGAALIQLVYDFVAAQNIVRGAPPFPIPQVRYVRVALAVADNVTRDTYLLEECIDEDSDGVFLKYINNNLNSPISRPDHPDRKEIGEFLAFAQHVQYLKTQKMAFVSDMQGLYTLLTLSFVLTPFQSRWPYIAIRPTDNNISVIVSRFVYHFSSLMFALQRPCRTPFC
jgi:hypothetical protein